MPRRRIRPVCNLYSVYTTQEAMRRAFEVARDSAGNVPPLPAIFRTRWLLWYGRWTASAS